MKRSEMLRMKLQGPLDAIQMCRDIVEGNFNAVAKEADITSGCVRDIDIYELQARIYTDLEILVMNQTPWVTTVPDATGYSSGRDFGDKTDHPEPSSASR